MTDVIGKITTDTPVVTKITDNTPVIGKINGKASESIVSAHNTSETAHANVRTATNINYTDTNSNLGEATDVQAALDNAGTQLASAHTELANKVDKVTGKGLSANDYTTAEKNKLAGIDIGAEANVNADWNSSSGDSQILNKPEIPDASALMPKSGGVLENYREKLTTLSGTTTTINLSLGNVFTHALSGDTTYTISNAVSGQAHSFTLIIAQPTTPVTLTFPASVKWQGGEIPDLTTASKTYVLTFLTVDGGTNWLGMFGGEF